jgi:hypothetical protein
MARITARISRLAGGIDLVDGVGAPDLGGRTVHYLAGSSTLTRK